MFELIDTHCHLTSEDFATDLDQVLQAAGDAGVGRIVIPGVDLESSRRAIELSQSHPLLFAAVGVQPEFSTGYSHEHFAEFEKLARMEKVVAIGEIGLDFHYPPVDAELQQSVMNEMLELAEKVRKPVLVHSRDAMGSVLSILADWINRLDAASLSKLAAAPGIMHAFEGNLNQAEEAIRMGFALGVGGPVTYKNAVLKRNVFEAIGLQHLVLETDSPYLPPHPYRGERNEPAHLKEVALKLSEILNQPLETVALKTTFCAKRIFGWIA